MYASGKIYKIVNDINDDIYVGSTCQQLSNRMSCHRSHSNNDQFNGLLYQAMRHFGTDHFKIILIELFPCNLKIELCAREDHHIRELKPKLNVNNAVLNKDKLKIVKARKDKKYNANHKDKVSDTHKSYYLLNQETIKERVRKYRNDNKLLISEKLKETRHCDFCDCEVRKHDFPRHKLSKKHQSNILIEKV